MTVQELAARLSLPQRSHEAALAVPLSGAEEQAWRRLFVQDQQAFEEELSRRETPERLALALYLRWACGLMRSTVAAAFRTLSFGIPSRISLFGAKSASGSLAGRG